MVTPRASLFFLLVVVGVGWAFATQPEAASRPAQTLAPGDLFEGAVHLKGTNQAIALPGGEGTVVAQIEGRGPDTLVVLAEAEGAHMKGLIWARSAADPIELATWCAGADARRHFEPLQAGDAEDGCLWVRQWDTRRNPEDLEAYWRQAFERLKRDRAEIPAAFIAAGYYVTGGGNALTIEYSFNADDVSEDEVVAWTGKWQKAVLAAYRGEPEAAPAPAWP